MASEQTRDLTEEIKQEIFERFGKLSTNVENNYKKFGIIGQEYLGNRKYLYKCICGSFFVATKSTLSKGTFCINENCSYFQPSKRLDKIEMKIILEKTKNIKVVNIEGTDRREENITFSCGTCGFEQKNSWRSIQREKFCKNSKCKDKAEIQTINIDLIKVWFSSENYSLPEDISYTGKKGKIKSAKYPLICPNGTEFIVSVRDWSKGRRCACINCVYQRQKLREKIKLDPDEEKIRYKSLCKDILLDEYSENEISTRDLPVIFYTNQEKKNMIYTPLFFLENESVLIECSDSKKWKKNKDEFKLKFKSCVEEGYSVQLYIFENQQFKYRRIFSGEGERIG